MILRIKNRRFDFFNSFNLNLKFDSVANAFSFNVYFDPENKDHRDLFHLGHYHTCTVEHEGQQLLSGFLLSHVLKNSSKKELSGIGGYSLTGVLEDCNIPPSLYPLQADGLSLKEIAQKLLKPFNLKFVIDSSVSSKMNSIYEETTASETATIKGYLTELAAQKNIIISNTVNGELLFTKANTKKNPIIDFNDGIPATTYSLSFNGQAMHSQITALKEPDIDGGNSGEFTVTNPFVPFVFRPKVVTQSSGDDNDTESVAKQALAAEIKNISLDITTDRWLVDGNIIMPGNIITVTNPEIYLYNKTKWFIEEVNLIGNSKSTTATLKCVLPCVYDGSTPKNVFND